ncbi:unnamed protein product, partial [Musa acuminata var. zebrina]
WTSREISLLFHFLSSKNCSQKKETERPVETASGTAVLPTHSSQFRSFFQVGHEPALISGSAKIRANGRVLHVGMSHSLVHSSASCFVHSLHEGQFHCSNIGWLYAMC